jgi:hypothetical protein
MCDAIRRYVMAVMLCLVGATAVQAQGLPGIPTGTVMSEVMMDLQGTEAQLYGAMLGVSPSPLQSLSGTTSTDLSAGSFSFSLNSGSTYLGQAISDSVQGQFNSATGSYDYTVTGAAALGFKWSETGSITPVAIDLGVPKWELKSYGAVYTLLSFPPKYIYGQTDLVTILGPGLTSPALSLRSSSLADPLGNNLGISIGTDQFDPVTGRYIFQDLFQRAPKAPFQLLSFEDVTTGTTPITGGAGTYITTISSVPEPSSWVMGLLGALGLLGYAWWTRKAAGAWVPTVASRELSHLQESQ